MAEKKLRLSKVYEVDFKRDESGWIVASIDAIPGCHTQGRDEAKARERLREALGCFDEEIAFTPILSGPGSEPFTQWLEVVLAQTSPAEVGMLVGQMRHEAEYWWGRVAHSPSMKLIGHWVIDRRLLGDLYEVGGYYLNPHPNFGAPKELWGFPLLVNEKATSDFKCIELRLALQGGS